MKRQRPLENFFKSQGESQTYFFLDSSWRAEWRKEKPENVIQWESTVQWNDMKLLITLGTSMKPHIPQEEEKKKKIPINASLLSLMKSNLQKCIRRKLTLKALKTTMRFLEWDENQFLRRLAIIMMEDVVLHESLSTVVWLNAAHSKDFPLSPEIHLWLLSLVEYLSTEGRESYWTLGITNSKQVLLEKEMIKTFYSKSKKHPRKQMLFTLLFRRSYGGMNGDCIMMMSFAELLLEEEGPESKIISTSPLRSSEFRVYSLSQVGTTGSERYRTMFCRFSLLSTNYSIVGEEGEW